MTQSLAGRTVLLTGAAGGIGRVLTKSLLDAGANVMAADISEVGLEALRNENDANGLACGALDISDAAACAAMVEATLTRFGGLDILINNGALGMGSIRPDHMANLVGMDEVSPETWDRFVSVNLSGAWYLTRAAVPVMKDAGWGRIITITTSFFTMLRAKFHPYGPVKAALEAMSAGHASEFAGTGITVNVVVPGGPVNTPMVHIEANDYRAEDLIQPSQMAPPIVWLCSDEANDVTGNRYVAAHWDNTLSVADARAASQAPIAWPDLAGAPVWPGGKPDD